MAAVAPDAAKIRSPNAQTRPTAIIQIRGKQGKNPVGDSMGSLYWVWQCFVIKEMYH